MLKSIDAVGDTDAERRPIRLTGPCPQAGIAAALRRAFDNPLPQGDDIDDLFDQLLSQVN